MSTTRSFRTLATLTLALITAVALAAVIFANRSSASEPNNPQTVPMCDLEDGSTQELCWWRDDANGWYLNINFGQAVYVPLNNELIDFSE